jgi:hypothetical protein
MVKIKGRQKSNGFCLLGIRIVENRDNSMFYSKTRLESLIGGQVINKG